MPSATPWEKRNEKTIPDISLYAHLRTTAAIAACIGHELTETDVNTLLTTHKDSNKKICALIKGDISGIQNFLYQVVSDGAANQLRGRSFYLQLLTEAIAYWVLRQLDLPITNLLLASGGHFYILAPYTDAKKELDTLRQQISQKLWTLHRGNISCILAGISIKARDFKAENFFCKWDAVSGKVQQRKQQKWIEMGSEVMFQNLFEPHENKQGDEQNEAEKDPWQFGELGKQLRNARYLITYNLPESPIPNKPNWHEAVKAFGMAGHLCAEAEEKPTPPEHTEHATVYRIGDTDFLKDIEKYQCADLSLSYDFRIFKSVIARPHDTDDTDKIADYD
ncbi:MAG: hypothetical protein MJE68_31840, partial [Proteobacteria bacterium]|nr:hypothetical protein [Pseudomonadota bacterium]